MAERPDEPSSRPAIRASDAEREHVVEVLRDAAAEGRLSFEELADRIDAASTARTRAELAALTGDLPAPDSPSAHDLALQPEAAAGAGWPAPRRAAQATAPPAARSAVFGNVRQVGAWRVPHASRWWSVFGDIDLDLRDAIVGHSRIEVDVGTIFGDVTLLVPDGVVVDVRVRTTFGKVRQDVGLSGPPGAPVVVLTGGTWFGDVRIPSRRLRERLVDLFHGRLGR